MKVRPTRGTDLTGLSAAARGEVCPEWPRLQVEAEVKAGIQGSRHYTAGSRRG